MNALPPPLYNIKFNTYYQILFLCVIHINPKHKNAYMLFNLFVLRCSEIIILPTNINCIDLMSAGLRVVDDVRPSQKAFLLFQKIICKSVLIYLG